MQAHTPTTLITQTITELEPKLEQTPTEFNEDTILQTLQRITDSGINSEGKTTIMRGDNEAMTFTIDRHPDNTIKGWSYTTYIADYNELIQGMGNSPIVNQYTYEYGTHGLVEDIITRIYAWVDEYDAPVNITATVETIDEEITITEQEITIEATTPTQAVKEVLNQFNTTTGSNHDYRVYNIYAYDADCNTYSFENVDAFDPISQEYMEIIIYGTQTVKGELISSKVTITVNGWGTDY